MLFALAYARRDYERLAVVGVVRGAWELGGKCAKHTCSCNTLAGIYEPVIPKIALRYALSARHTVIHFNLFIYK